MPPPPLTHGHPPAPHRARSLWYAARAAALLTLAGLAQVVGAEEGPTVTLAVPAGIPVQIDGALSFAEWKDAASVPLGDGVGLLRVKQVRGTLLLAYASARPWVRGSSLLLFACPDRQESNAFGPGALSLDYEPLEHNRPHVLVRRAREQGWEDVPDAALVRGSVNDHDVALELALPLPVWGVTGKTPPPLRVAVVLTRAVAGQTASWPPGLDVGASTGQAPPDLASSRRWARLTGFVDADGPGALSKATLERLREEDRELTDKGRQAHDRALLILEEGGRKLEKEDALVEREVLEPLAWIAAREPLHPYDVLVRGQVLRHLNRHAEALASFDALALVRRGDYRESAAYERARTLQSLERYEEEAQAWRDVAAVVAAEGRAPYEAAARRAESNVALREAEPTARRTAQADPGSPLVLLTTNRGSVLLCLHAHDAPKAVAHFLALVERSTKDGTPFFDGTLFHRVIGDAFAQGGDPRTRTDGCDADLSGPASDTIEVELSQRHGFFRGALAFARAVRLENASQFFLLATPQPALAAGKYTLFGHVVSGLDVVCRLERCDTLLTARVLRGLPTPPAPPAEPAAERPEPGAR